MHRCLPATQERGNGCTAGAGQWLVFAQTAGELGICQAVAVPLLIADHAAVGAMDLYRTASSR